MKTLKAATVGYALDIYLRNAMKRGISGKQVRIYSSTKDNDPVQSTVIKVNTVNERISLVEFKINDNVSLPRFVKLGIMNLCSIRLSDERVISFVISVKM